MTGNQTAFSKPYSYYVLAVLGLTYAFSFMDRQIVSILLGDLKAEFELNDTQLGLLSGLAFALFYSFLAIPIARLADRTHRINIISIAVALWSIVTALCAFVGNFTQLFIARIGVGVGEAGGLSPAHSVIADYFDERQRSLAISIFSLGAAFGAMLGMAAGGYIAQHFGWRMAFLAAGLPGIALALVVKFTVREPERGGMDATPRQARRTEPFAKAVRSLVRNRAYRGVYVAHTLVVFTGYAIATWLPQLMLRNYEVSQAEVGGIIGVAYFLGVAGGMFSGGLLATYFMQFDARWQLRLPVIGLVLALPIYWFALNAGDFHTAAILFGAGLFFFNMQHGPSLAVVQSAVEPHQRATAAALNFFASNLFGLALGPLAVGWISDTMAPTYGDASLTIAIGASMIVSVPGIFIFFHISKYLSHESRQ